jgi:uncharacterized damage-inducible protein DinB
MHRELPMPFTTAVLIEAIRHSRRHFLKHLRGLPDDQWDWKPYPECKSIRETLAHLVWIDRVALVSLETGAEPDYAALEEPEHDRDRLRALLEASHERLCQYLTTRYAAAPLDTEVSLYGDRQPLGRALAYFPSEDYYHSGQVAFIRMATDPGWDYYASIYGSD